MYQVAHIIDGLDLNRFKRFRNHQPLDVFHQIQNDKDVIKIHIVIPNNLPPLHGDIYMPV